jgi:hypothetical protein
LCPERTTPFRFLFISPVFVLAVFRWYENGGWILCRNPRACCSTRPLHILCPEFAFQACVFPQAPKLPGKKVLGAMNPTFVDERRRGLEAYLQALIVIPGVWKCAPLVAFLDGPTQSLRDKVCVFVFARGLSLFPRLSPHDLPPFIRSKSSF